MKVSSQSGRLAAVFAIVVFAVAAPDGGPVLVGRVPCIPAIPSATVAALDLALKMLALLYARPIAFRRLISS